MTCSDVETAGSSLSAIYVVNVVVSVLCKHRERSTCAGVSFEYGCVTKEGLLILKYNTTTVVALVLQQPFIEKEAHRMNVNQNKVALNACRLS